VARPSDLYHLKRLGALCDAQHRLAIQEQARAAREAGAAAQQRMADEAAAAAAERAWQDVTQLGWLDPEIAAAAGTALVARAEALRLAIDRQAQADRTLSARDGARRESAARLEQAGEVTAVARAKARRTADERLLAAIEDRTAYRWRRT
jgi:hypothetical protein